MTVFDIAAAVRGVDTTTSANLDPRFRGRWQSRAMSGKALAEIRFAGGFAALTKNG